MLLGGTLRAEVVLAVANVVWFVLLLAGGIVVPLDRLPGPVAAVAALLPSGALAEGLRTALATGAAPGAGPVLVLLAWAAAGRPRGAHRPAALTAAPTISAPPTIDPWPDPRSSTGSSPSRPPCCAGWRSPRSSRRPGSRSPARSCGSPAPGWAARPGRSASPAAWCPTPHPEVAALHQWVEFGNRLLTFAVVLVAGLCFLAALGARPRRPRLVRLALVQPLGVVAQAVIGGFTVLLGAGLVERQRALPRLDGAGVAGRAAGAAAGEGDGPPRRWCRARSAGWWHVDRRARRAAARRHVRHRGRPARGRRRHAAARRGVPAMAQLHADLLFAYLACSSASASRCAPSPPRAALQRRYAAARGGGRRAGRARRRAVRARRARGAGRRCTCWAPRW